MNQQNALQEIDAVRRDARQRCFLGHVRSLLSAIRTRHRLADAVDLNDGALNDVDEDLASPSLHDVYVGELEATVLAHSAAAEIDTQEAIRYDSPHELARARRVFTATLLVPLVLFSALLIVSGSALDRSMFSLLRFSTVALAIPLAVSGIVWLYRTLARRHA